MHIPDGYLSPQTCASLYAAAGPFWYVALRRVRKALHSELVSLVGFFSAFCFVVMMFNLPLPGGTTGHAVGMGVAAIVLGPWASILAVSTALVIQALLFGDGGLTAIGANCFNMAIVGSLVAYSFYRLLAGRSPITAKRRLVAAGIAGYAAINAAACCAAIEFGIQPILFHDSNGVPLYCPYPLSIALPAMMIGHLTFAGLAELILTAGIFSYLQRAHPELLARTAPGADPQSATGELPAKTFGRRKLWLALTGIVILTPLGILAVGSAWGEWNVSDFSDPASRAQMSRATGVAAIPHQAPSGMAHLSNIWKAPFARYAPDFVRNPSWGYMLSAMAGVCVVLLTLGLMRRVAAYVGKGRRKLRPSFIESTIRSLFEAFERSLFAEEIARSKGLLQRFEPRVKLAGIAALILATVLVRHIPVLVALLVFSIGLAAFSGLPFRLLAKTVWIPALLVSGLMSVPALFITPGTPLARLPWLNWTITQQGLTSVTLLLLRVETASTFSALLIVTTEWARVLRALRFFRIPVTAVVILGFAYRYIFLLLRTAQEMFESRHSRLVGELAGRERRLVASSSAGALLARTFALSAEVHSAMRSRGFQGEIYLLEDPLLLSLDYLFLAGFFALALLAFVLGR